jgi:hypothetical protein
MARHRKDYSGERLTARLHLQLTPSDRKEIEAGAAEEGLSPTEFARALLLNGLRAQAIGRPAREAKRAVLATSIAKIDEAGKALNRHCHRLNEIGVIEEPRAVEALCKRLVAAMEAIPPRVASRHKNPEARKLVAALAAVGNNARQLRGAGQKGKAVAPLAALMAVEAQIMKTLDMVLPG